MCTNGIISFLLSISHKVDLNKMMQNATFFLSCVLCFSTEILLTTTLILLLSLLRRIIR